MFTLRQYRDRRMSALVSDRSANQVALGTNTDPYQKAESKNHLTRGLICCPSPEPIRATWPVDPRNPGQNRQWAAEGGPGCAV
jgi:hypothetical protein